MVSPTHHPSPQQGDILLHTCCARCTTYVLKTLRGEGYRVTALWYNPNIHPYLEHQHRLASMQGYAEQVELPLMVWGGYAMPLFLRQVSGREAERCEICYRMRLEKTAQVAKELGFPQFTTTLLLSIYQDRELIRGVGKEIAERERLEFHAADFSHGWQEHYRLSDEAGLYRQKYCGCIYSEWERHTKKEIGELLKDLEVGEVNYIPCPS